MIFVFPRSRNYKTQYISFVQVLGIWGIGVGISVRYQLVAKIMPDVTVSLRDWMEMEVGQVSPSSWGGQVGSHILTAGITESQGALACLLSSSILDALKIDTDERFRSRFCFRFVYALHPLRRIHADVDGCHPQTKINPMG